MKIQGIYITCLHLSSRKEATRLKQIEKIKKKLDKAGVWGFGEPHIWDFDEEGWRNIEKKRKGSSKEVAEPEPTEDVTRLMKELVFSDCWVETGRQGTLETCR